MSAAKLICSEPVVPLVWFAKDFMQFRNIYFSSNQQLVVKFNFGHIESDINFTIKTYVSINLKFGAQTSTDAKVIESIFAVLIV